MERFQESAMDLSKLLAGFGNYLGTHEQRKYMTLGKQLQWEEISG